MYPFIHNSWQDHLNDEFKQDYFKELSFFLEEEYQSYSIYPNREQIFEAFEHTSFENIKVVILGQDPYHGEGQAHGMAFSVQKGVKIPPSLKNIYKELTSDLGVESPTHGQLTSWADQGVLLLNTVLTVRKGEANSHKNKGWEIFTNQVIQKLSQRKEPIVFLLWGAPAQKKKVLIDLSRHIIIEAPHPSPLAAYRGFFGSKPFSKTNEVLIKNGQKPINWQIQD